MRALDHPFRALLGGSALVVACLCAGLAPGPAGAADPAPAFRFSAPIEVLAPATFIELALPASAYAHSRQPELRDLRIVDSRGERVPFALPPARALLQRAERLTAATLYALPPQPSAGGVWESPVEVRVDGDRVSVTRPLAGRSAALGGARRAAAASASGGWLIDLGERKPDAPAPTALRLAWSSPAEFTAAYSLETSADLRSWRSAGSGQLMALAMPAAATTVPAYPSPSSALPQPPAQPLTQPLIELASDGARFVRLVWAEPSTAPHVTAAVAMRPEQSTLAIDRPSEIVVEPTPEPAADTARDRSAVRSLHFDLGAVLPLVELNLRFGPGSRVAPARVQGRDRPDQPWRELGGAVFYRFERGASTSQSPPLPLAADARYLRIVPDERAAALDPAATRLVVQAQLAHAVFVAQGVAPYTLLAGAAEVASSALPLATLVPRVDDERPRFGRASLGAWSEVEAVARQAAADERQARWRPWLLWMVLLVGVAVLGFMVWRLTRGQPAPASEDATR